MQKHLGTFRKQQKFEITTYFQLYPSHSIAPRLYEVIKSHTLEKCYLMGAILSTTDTPTYGNIQYLAELIQSTVNKSEYKTTNLSSFCK